MVSLIDIVDLKRTTTIRGKEMPITGLSAAKIAQLLSTYPELRDAIAGRGRPFSPATLIDLGPKIVADVIAIGTGNEGNAAEVANAANLMLGDQLKLLEAIFEATFPDGSGPFVDKLRSWGFLPPAVVGNADASAESGWALGTNSQKPSNPSQAAEATAGSMSS